MNNITINFDTLDSNSKILLSRILGRKLDPDLLRKEAKELSKQHNQKYNNKYFANKLNKSYAAVTYAFQGHAPYILFLIHRELQRIKDPKNYSENN